MRVAVELGPKRTKVVAYAIDWPGLERNGSFEIEALEHVKSYRARYQRVAERADLLHEFQVEPAIDIVDIHEGTGSTDYWGISFAHGSFDRLPISAEELERHLSLLQACWTEFDEIALRVSPELREGRRGRGRNRDQVVRHTLATELDWVKKLGIRLSPDDVCSPSRRRDFHSAIAHEIHSLHQRDMDAQANGGPAWTLPFLIRHLAYDVMDHAWEMEDRDLTDQ